MKLAINGGQSINTIGFPKREFLGKQAIHNSLHKLIDSENLSGYRGSFGQHFWGGENVRKVEKSFKLYLDNANGKNHYVLAVNSCTSALQIACGAIGIKGGDDIIVTPWSMTCSATAPLLYNGNVIFADIDKETFCLDPKSIEAKITPYTKAIIVVDLFGGIANFDEIKKIADKYNLYIIEDAAQAIGSFNYNSPAGTNGDIGCFSFTQGKHFACGEGGFIVTKNYDLYMKCALLRNHAEAVINSIPESSPLNKKARNWSNMVGFNMRMTELQAVVLYEQLQYIDDEINKREENVTKLFHTINIEGIDFPIHCHWDYYCNCKYYENHSYYVLPMKYNEKIIGVPRDRFINAVKAELEICKTNMGVTQKEEALIWNGYIKPLYKMPVFADKQSLYYQGKIQLPVVERLQEKEFFMMSYHALPLEDKHINLIAGAFKKVYENRSELL